MIMIELLLHYVCKYASYLCNMYIIIILLSKETSKRKLNYTKEKLGILKYLKIHLSIKFITSQK